MKYFVRAILATIIAALLSSCSYNSMVEADENINAQWAKVENQYQRRADLVPNLVNTVKGYAAHESETLEAVIAARSKATQITVDPANLTEENLQKYQEAQGELSSALGKLLAITENYPDLKANQNFLELQAQLCFDYGKDFRIRRKTSIQSRSECYASSHRGILMNSNIQ